MEESIYKLTGLRDSRGGSSLRIRNSYHIVKLDLVRHALNDLAEKLYVPRLPEGDGMHEERRLRKWVN